MNLPFMKKKDELPPTPKRVELEEFTDTFSKEEQKTIVEIVMADASSGMQVMDQWLTDRKLDVQHYEGEKPSILENLTKKAWQSDRNLGLCASVCDSYQSILLSTCWNPDTLHFTATDSNEIDNKDNLERFTKWAVGANECNVFPEIDDYIHNKNTQGFSVFHIYWKVWYEWCDRRIPNKSGGYDIKTEKVRFERGVMENIDNLEDFIIPDYGKNLQDQSYIIHVIHIDNNELKKCGESKKFVNITPAFIDSLKGASDDRKKDIKKEKADQLGLADKDELDLRVYPTDIYVWYGEYTKNGRTEKYRFYVEPTTQTFLGGKPVRKINRTGKYPFVGGPFIRRPGFIRGKSMPKLIAHIVNAFNNVYNQKSDFQYVTNCPFGFHNPEEGYQQQTYELMPGISYPVSGKPNEAVYFPNLQRSMAWAESDIRILFEMLERVTGSASFFMTNMQNASGTATRDNIINEKSETRFSLWVKRTIYEICEAITMLINLYQDWAPAGLGDRILGKDGKKLFKNLSIETLRGNYVASMSPDIISGSRTMEKQLMMWMVGNLANSLWLQPQVNPKGNWNMWADTLKVLGKYDPERYLGPEPKNQMGEGDDIDSEWSMFMKGEVIDPPEGATQMAMSHLIGHARQKEEKYHELDKEYRKNFDAHLFKTQMNMMEFIKNAQQEQIASRLAMKMIEARESGQVLPQGGGNALPGQNLPAQPSASPSAGVPAGISELGNQPGAGLPPNMPVNPGVMQ